MTMHNAAEPKECSTGTEPMKLKEPIGPPYLQISINQLIIFFLPKSAYIENKFDSNGQNDIS